MQHPVKAVDFDAGRIGGYLIVWGSASQPDLQGDYFTPQTDLALDWFARRPALYHHGLDGAVKAAVIGVIDALQPDDVGLWAEAQLDTRQRYVQVILELVKRGLLSWSSGSLPHLVQRDDDGQITRWPLIEGSLTPSPAEPRHTSVQAVKSAYAQLGLDCARLDDPTNTPTDAPVGRPYTLFTTSTLKGNPMNDIPEATKRLPLHNPTDASPRIEVGSPFDPLTAEDMLHGYMLLRETKSFRGVSERYANALAHKVSRANLSAIKANELATSTQAAFGDEWVPDLWSQQIWQKVRQDNVILPLFRSIEMPSNPFELPTEGTDPTVYYVTETINEDQLTLAGTTNPIPDSKVGTGKVTLDAKKLALRVGFSAELVEDAIIPVLNVYREQAIRAIANAVDHVLLNGDSATSGNVNLDGATPTATNVYMAFDGLRKTAIATANSVDAANADVTLALLRGGRFKLPTRYAARPADLAWIVGGQQYSKMLAMQEFVTMDKAGSYATNITGQIGIADGVPVLVSAEMADSFAATGKIHTTGANNTQASVICVYRPGWIIGYRRRVSVSLDYLPYYDSYQMTATVRLALARLDANVAGSLINLKK
jgi:phage head maturation protease